METCTIVFSIINAIGSLATAITLIIAITKFSRKLKVKGEFPIKTVVLIFCPYIIIHYMTMKSKECFCARGIL